MNIWGSNHRFLWVVFWYGQIWAGFTNPDSEALYFASGAQPLKKGPNANIWVNDNNSPTQIQTIFGYVLEGFPYVHHVWYVWYVREPAVRLWSRLAKPYVFDEGMQWYQNVRQTEKQPQSPNCRCYHPVWAACSREQFSANPARFGTFCSFLAFHLVGMRDDTHLAFRLPCDQWWTPVVQMERNPN